MHPSRQISQVLVMTILAGAYVVPLSLAAQERGGNPSERVVVVKITDVEIAKSGSTLRVSAKGQVPTGGYTDPLLSPVVYFIPPSDGIQDYYLTALKPSLATQVISEVSAPPHEWANAPDWVKGVRIHGDGDGVMVKMLESAGVRARTGESGRHIVVAKITQVDYEVQKSKPPVLLVTATGEVENTNHTDFRLDRIIYVRPPTDGIQDYFLKALAPNPPPINPVTQKIEAKNEWKDFEKDAPWLKGVRIHGLAGGTKVKMFGK